VLGVVLPSIFWSSSCWRSGLSALGLDIPTQPVGSGAGISNVGRVSARSRPGRNLPIATRRNGMLSAACCLGPGLELFSLVIPDPGGFLRN